MRREIRFVYDYSNVGHYIKIEEIINEIRKVIKNKGILIHLSLSRLQRGLLSSVFRQIQEKEKEGVIKTTGKNPSNYSSHPQKVQE
jgi:ubiquinone/menaquinone biosynthesis C-methylase UbiE